MDLIHENDKIVVATSGGPDSMYLLSNLINERLKKNLELIVVHINHQTRKECNEEEEFLRTYCQNNNVPIKVFKIEKYQKGHFTEEEARNIRLNFYAKVCQENSFDYIVTAHHADDVIETILMKILRGSTLSSIVGLKETEKFKNVIIKHPMLNITKEEILNYLKKHEISYVVDKSNESLNHLRNRLRLNIVPLLKKEQPKLAQKFLKFSKELQEQNEYIENKLAIIEAELQIKDGYNLKEFLLKDSYIQKELLKKIMKNYYWENITKINEQTYQMILHFLKHHRKNILPLPLDNHIEINQNFFKITHNITYEPYKIECGLKTNLPNGGCLIKTDKYQEKSNYEIHLNSKDLKLPLYITTRQEGMKMKVKNLNGYQKVKDILISAKVPPSKKDSIPIMIDSNNNVIWILGIKKSQYDLEKSEKYDIIYRYEGRI